jgi:alcohol dehydrogenase class IV
MTGQQIDVGLPARVIAGPGEAASVGSLVAGLSGRRTLVLCDLTDAGRQVERLGLGGRVTVITVGDVSADAREDQGEHLATAIEGERPDVVVAFGGEAVFRAAGQIALGPVVVGVPTVAGGGLGQATCRIVVLDPDLSAEVPPGVAGVGGIAAVARAVEAFVTSRRSVLTDLFAREAWRLLAGAYVRVVSAPGDIEALGWMLLGGLLADIASSGSGLGAVEACARPLVRRPGLEHGHAVAALLPEVVRWNARAVADRYGELASVRGEARRAEGLAATIEDFVAAGALPSGLASAGVVEGDLPALAEQAAREPAGMGNPRRFDVAGALEVYVAAF